MSELQMDKTEQEYLKFVKEDILRKIQGITSRAMFGGYGIYKHGVIFAIIAESNLYFKVGELNIDDYKELDSEPFVYEGKTKLTTMPYWLVPEEILYDDELIEEWVDKSVAVSKASKKKKK